MTECEQTLVSDLILFDLQTTTTEMVYRENQHFSNRTGSVLLSVKAITLQFSFIPKTSGKLVLQQICPSGRVYP